MNALYAAALHDTAWISSLRAHINPLYLDPPDDAAESIGEEWRDTLHSFLVQDLKEDASGPRMHLWPEKNCLIVYYLNETRSLLRLADFYQLNDETYSDMYGCFANNATWIFCPQTMGPCPQDPRCVTIKTPRSTRGASIWHKRKPSLSLSRLSLSPCPCISVASSATSESMLPGAMFPCACRWSQRLCILTFTPSTAKSPSQLPHFERRHGYCSTPANRSFITYNPCRPVFDLVIENTIYDDTASRDAGWFPMSTCGFRRDGKNPKTSPSVDNNGPGGPRPRVPTPIPGRNMGIAYARRTGKTLVQGLNGGHLRIDEEVPSPVEDVFMSPLHKGNFVCESELKKDELMKRILVNLMGKAGGVIWRAQSS
ncbi:hypothetical protein BS47DRAFT_571104 [Hydnum rufescens UP504]|uniref:Uncharacterized protein n=1 Tax=Hydnum rufescens UP504 TaxID=1448309 RepID=A0A9P6B3M8_9AGAM|nr:hypothetical protein BS47DRAFT_571104 [Hydnum rufescens UP504]